MKSRTLSATALILLTPLVVLALQTQADQVRKADLKSKSFTAGPLKITFLSFGRHGRFIYEDKPGTNRAEVERRLCQIARLRERLQIARLVRAELERQLSQIAQLGSRLQTASAAICPSDISSSSFTNADLIVSS